MDSREQRALDQWAEMTVYPIKKSPGQFMVCKVQGKMYAVDLNKETCTCPDFVNRQKPCKHIYRVVLEGYEPAPKPVRSPAVNWKPEDSEYLWFDIRMVNAGTECLFCRGAKKDWKFWVAVPQSPTNDAYTLYWGAFDEQELHRKNVYGGKIGCQRKAKTSRAPYHEVAKRAEGKRAKGYNQDARLRDMLFQNLGFDSSAIPAADPEPQPEKKEEKPKTNWKPEAPGFVWFNTLSLLAQDLWKNCFCLVAPGKKKESQYWIAFWDNQRGRVCLFWGEYDSLAELYTHPLKGQCEELQGLSNPYEEARARFLQKTKEDENYDAPHRQERQALFAALIARYAVGDTLVIKKPKKTKKKPKTNWKPEVSNFTWF